MGVKGILFSELRISLSQILLMQIKCEKCFRNDQEGHWEFLDCPLFYVREESSEMNCNKDVQIWCIYVILFHIFN